MSRGLWRAIIELAGIILGCAMVVLAFIEGWHYGRYDRGTFDLCLAILNFLPHARRLKGDIR